MSFRASSPKVSRFAGSGAPGSSAPCASLGSLFRPGGFAAPLSAGRTWFLPLGISHPLRLWLGCLRVPWRLIYPRLGGYARRIAGGVGFAFPPRPPLAARSRLRGRLGRVGACYSLASPAKGRLNPPAHKSLKFGLWSSRADLRVRLPAGIVGHTIAI